jgi:hypothetical protein
MISNITAGRTKRTRKAPPERHRWTDEWLIAKGQPLLTLVDEVLALIASREQRRRARRATDAVNHRALVNVIVSNLAYAVLMPPPTGKLAISTRNTTALTRYENRALGSKPLRALFEALEDLGLMSRHYSIRRGEASSIWPLKRFADEVQRLGVTLGDFGRDPNEEVILLARSKPRPDGATKRRARIDYTDTATTVRYRAQVRNLNAFLASADITFDDDGAEPQVDCQQRGLRRHFTVLEDQPERFDQNGRLFGGFWMNIKSHRRARIRINKEPVTELDYSSMFTRLAYAELGARPPKGDLYAIEGASEHRSGIKMAMNVFLFDTNPRRPKWPSEMGLGVATDFEALNGSVPEAAAYEALLPKGWTVSVTRKAILKKHPALKPAWGHGLGHRLMFEESRLMLAVLEHLRSQGISALPLHDAIIVPRSSTEVARRAMEQLGKQLTGVDLPVSEKTGPPR